jgi:hypothetical protein
MVQGCFPKLTLARLVEKLAIRLSDLKRFARSVPSR